MDLLTFWMACLGLAIALVLQCVYRIYLHPLRHIPGPKLAAMSHLYDFYYNIVHRGQYVMRIVEMHQEYGPIVRVAPDEIHISDPSFYDEIYAPSRRRRDKPGYYIPLGGFPTAEILTLDHDVHRMRRAIISPFFSRRSIQEISDVTRGATTKLMDRLQQFHDEDKIVRLDDAFAAMASDIITYLVYGHSQGFLDSEDFESEIRLLVNEAAATCHINRFIPPLATILRSMPPRWLALFTPGRSKLFIYIAKLFELAGKTPSSPDPAVEDSEAQKRPRHKTVMARLGDPRIPAEERTLNRFQDEGAVFLGGGTETTGSTLTFASYILGTHPDIVQRLRAEVKQVLPTPTSTCTWLELEKLPYLTAFIYETTRLNYGLMLRAGRIAPTETLQYKDYVIPPGTIMSSNTYMIHRDPILFPDCDTFDPERWLQGQKSEELKRYHVTFSKGSRACVGKNLAWNELYFTIAYMVRRFDFEMHNTTAEDMEIVGEAVFPLTRRGQRTVYAKVKPVE
ncbi:cytochrome P450 [Aspergillus ellipticus CBS 707.79]|uniref:Cytochrome P450 n=1 Tax=Aspergillus ellipticus CBS 707.79 TaxID=1448320 RepID=A0A319DVB2_9EURO|nr:cytochrome P450 [Aspergillus ellipticus CBS 707.79]